MSKESLHEKCIMGRIQKPNESLHSKIRHSLSKTIFYGLKTVQYSVTRTVIHHNFGYEAASHIQDFRFGKMCHYTSHVLQTRDRERTIIATTSKSKRRKIKMEADPDYAAGKFLKFFLVRSSSVV